MRSRVISNTGMLNALNISLTSSVTSRIEKQLAQLTLEIQLGKREGSVITVNSMKAAQGEDENIWREIQRELEDAGITEEMVNEHPEFIATWLINAINSGQLEEKVVGNVPQGEILGNNSDHSKAESDKDESVEEDPNVVPDGDSMCALPDELSENRDRWDEFSRAAAQNIAEFQQLGREAMEALDYKEARQQLEKARNYAVLIFGGDSKKAKGCTLLLEEVKVHALLHPSGESILEMPAMEKQARRDAWREEEARREARRGRAGRNCARRDRRRNGVENENCVAM